MGVPRQKSKAVGEEVPETTRRRPRFKHKTIVKRKFNAIQNQSFSKQTATKTASNPHRVYSAIRVFRNLMKQGQHPVELPDFMDIPLANVEGITAISKGARERINILLSGRLNRQMSFLTRMTQQEKKTKRTMERHWQALNCCPAV